MATLSQARDALQRRLLTYLFRGSESPGLVLKGGAAMRVLTESARCSMDLDFDYHQHSSLASLQTSVRTAIERAVQGSGLVDSSISESKPTDTVARWKLSAQTSTGEQLHLTVEVSARRAPDPNHVVKIPVQIEDRTLPRVYVNVYDEQALADHKLAALMQRVADKLDLKRVPHWTTRLELALAEPGTLRVLDTASIVRVARDVRRDISKPSVERWIPDAVAANRLQRVVRGLFLNRLIAPPAKPCEAAVWLRSGAEISLQTVLGDAGVWNNSTDWVTAVVPLSPRYTTPSLGRVETGAGIFVFRGIPERLLAAGAEDDRLVAGIDYRRATPEAALLHWLYLSDSPRSRMSAPSLELNLSALDLRKLKRLATAMRIEDALNLWRGRKIAQDKSAGANA